MAGMYVVRVEDILAEIGAEVKSSIEKFEPIHSAHEGYAVILEELDEVWEQVKRNPAERRVQIMREELIQVSAMSARFIHDLIPDNQTHWIR